MKIDKLIHVSPNGKSKESCDNLKSQMNDGFLHTDVLELKAQTADFIESFGAQSASRTHAFHIVNRCSCRVGEQLELRHSHRLEQHRQISERFALGLYNNICTYMYCTTI